MNRYQLGMFACLRAILIASLGGIAIWQSAEAQSLKTARTGPLSATTAASEMSPGWNLGNTLEAIPNETAWGNPAPTEALMQGVRAAGFKSIRIPVAWSQYADANNNIDTKWMAHVGDVVKMARKADLYVIINIHWDGGWMQATREKEVAVNAKLRKFWTQIGSAFKNFDDHLLFAGSNEVGVDGVYGLPTPENAAVQNGYNQTFVSTVRQTGGLNRTRVLVVQGYNTDIDATVLSNKIPLDSVSGRLMMEVHYYSPYNFTLNAKSSIWQWGKDATDPAVTETWANEPYVDAEFLKMKSAFIDKGVPVILGEYACGLKPNYPGMNPFRKYWDMYITRAAVSHSLIPFYWDAGAGGGLFHRENGIPQDPDVIQLITGATQSTIGGKAVP